MSKKHVFGLNIFVKGYELKKLEQKEKQSAVIIEHGIDRKRKKKACGVTFM